MENEIVLHYDIYTSEGDYRGSFLSYIKARIFASIHGYKIVVRENNTVI